MRRDGGDTEIIRAAKAGAVSQVRRLLAMDRAFTQSKDRDGSTPLHCAAWKGHVEVAQVLLGAGAEVNAHNQNTHWGTTPLHAAAHANRKAVAELLLAHGADLRARNLNGRTPLGETAIHGATAVAELLKQHGATE